MQNKITGIYTIILDDVDVEQSMVTFDYKPENISQLLACIALYATKENGNAFIALNRLGNKKSFDMDSVSIDGIKLDLGSPDFDEFFNGKTLSELLKVKVWELNFEVGAL